MFENTIRVEKMGKAIAHGTANFLIGLDSYEQIL